LAVARAKTLLERASSGGYLPAIYLLVELLEREGAQDKAIDLLKVGYLIVELLEKDKAINLLKVVYLLVELLEKDKAINLLKVH